MHRRVTLRIKGKVQGVFFRESARREALRLKVNGWVKNLPDGDVLCLAEGDAAAVGELVQWCHRGPPSARVDGVELKEASGAPELTTFSVER